MSKKTCRVWEGLINDSSYGPTVLLLESERHSGSAGSLLPDALSCRKKNGKLQASSKAI